MTPIVRLLLLLNVAVFGLQQLTQDELVTHFALWPLGQHYFADGGVVGFQPWQLITYAFLHGSLPHIALNMYALYMFGGMVERVLGPMRFSWVYFASVLAGGPSSSLTCMRDKRLRSVLMLLTVKCSKARS